MIRENRDFKRFVKYDKEESKPKVEIDIPDDDMFNMNMTHYSNLYDLIISFDYFCFLTVNPKPDSRMRYRDHNEKWLKEFVKVYKDVKAHLLLSIELTKKGQIHYHLMLGFRTRHDKFTFIRRYLQRWFHMANVEPIWNGEPTYKFPYLYKDIDDTKGILDMKDDECPMMDAQDMANYINIETPSHL